MKLGTIFTDKEYDKAYEYVLANGYTIKEVETTEEEITDIETYFEDEEIEFVIQEAQDAFYDEDGNIIREATEEVREKQIFPVEKTRGVTKTVTVRHYQIVEIPQFEPTDDELKQVRISELKQKLSETDYVVIKIAEGEATAEEYSEVLANRKAWRAEINQLEG